MKVELLKDVVQNGVVKVSVRRPPRTTVGFFAGVVVDVSDITAAKWIKEGVAKAYVEEVSK